MWYQSEYNIGDIVSLSDYDIKEGVIIGAERIPNNPSWKWTGTKSEDEFDEYYNDWQYSIKYKTKEGIWEQDTFYESYID